MQPSSPAPPPSDQGKHPAFLAQVLALGSGTILGVILRLLVTVLAARALGIAGLGIYAQWLAWGLLLGRAAELGLPAAIQYFVRLDRAHRQPLFRLSTASLAWSAASIALLLPLLPLPLELKGTHHDIGAPLLSLVVYGATLTHTNNLSSFFLADGSARAYLIGANASLGVRFLLVTASLATGNPSIEVFIFCTTAAQLATSLWLHLSVRRTSREASPAPHPLRYYLSFSLRTHLGLMMKFAHSRLELLAVGAILGSVASGIYSVASTFRDLAQLPLSAYASPLLNRIVDASAGAPEKGREFMVSALFLHAGITFLLVSSAIVAMPIAVLQAFGPAYASATLPSQVLVAGAWGVSTTALCGMAFTAAGRPGTHSLLTSISGMIPLAFVFMSAYSYGLAAACIASLAGDTVMGLLSLMSLKYSLGYNRDHLVRGLQGAGRLVSIKWKRG